ncbi:MAG: hypothetical protein ACI4JZ_02010 [Oscillospiraceae bacterium]
MSETDFLNAAIALLSGFSFSEALSDFSPFDLDELFAALLGTFFVEPEALFFVFFGELFALFSALSERFAFFGKSAAPDCSKAVLEQFVLFSAPRLTEPLELFFGGKFFSSLISPRLFSWFYSTYAAR